MLLPIADRIILTQADNPRAADVDTLEGLIRCRMQDAGCRIVKRKKVREALGLARKNSGIEDIILVTGSLFVVGEARDLLVKD
ncbi:MAG: hypothetical protein ABH914_04010 [Candidatus Omnitrophota bacterium]